MNDTISGVFPLNTYEYHFHIDNVRFSLRLDGGLFQSEDAHKNLNLTLHTHDYYEWFLVTNGCMKLVCANGSTRILQKNDFAVITPGVSHYVEICADGTTRYNLCFFYERNGLEACDDLYGTLDGILRGHDYLAGMGGKELADINKRLSQLCGTSRRQMLCTCFAEMICSFCDTVTSAGSVSPVDALLENGALSRLERLETVFTSYYMYNIPLEHIAGKLGISTRQLNRIIKKEYGYTYHERITYVRISSARQLLTKTNFTAGEIAQCVGYTSLCGFYTAFKNQCGCLPIEYRKKTVQKENAQ